MYVQVIAQVGFKTRFVPVPSELPEHPQKFRLSTVKLDFDCSAPTKIIYLYKPVGGTALVPLGNPSSLPADVAMTTTLNNVTVPFVVRLETGTMDRGIYQNAVLFDPTSDSGPTPFAPPKGWNKRLLAQHGAGCPGSKNRHVFGTGRHTVPRHEDV